MELEVYMDLISQSNSLKFLIFFNCIVLITLLIVQTPKGNIMRSTLGTFPVIKLCGPTVVAESDIERNVH